MQSRDFWGSVGRSATAVAVDAVFLLVIPPAAPEKQPLRWSCREYVQTALTTSVIAALLHCEGRRLGTYAPQPKDWGRLGLGVLLGSAAVGTMLGIATLAGWLNSPGWGWEKTAHPEFIGVLALGLLGDAAIAVREELLHRGYAFDTLAQAVGAPIAGAWMSMVFALYHPLKPHFIVSNIVGGITLTLLRQYTGSIWASVGYHWAWNVMQTWVFGPTSGAPSLRPITIEGPALLVGRPGYAEPGLLVAIVNLPMLLWLRSQLQQAIRTG